MLEHLVDSVVNWGPLSAQSCYAFETGNRYLTHAINVETGVNLQIARYLNLKQTLLKLEKHVLPNCSEFFTNYYEKTSSNDRSKSYVFLENLYFGFLTITDNEFNTLSEALMEMNTLGTNNMCILSKFSAYKGLVKNDFVYSSGLKVNKRTDSSFARLIDKRVIRIIKFLVEESSKLEFILCNIVSVSNTSIIEGFDYCQKINSIQENSEIVSTVDILNVCIHIEAENCTYVLDIVNPYCLYA